MTGRLRAGAYGFTFSGLEGASDWLVESPGHWPEVEVVQRIGEPDLTSRVADDSGEVVLLGGSSVRLERQSRRIVYVGPGSLSPSELVHPYLAPAASLLAHWEGWLPLHAGGFVAEGRGWLVVSQRGGGKSTTLAKLASRGYGVLCDDLAVIRDGFLMAGPRSIDLRQADEDGNAHALGIVGARERWRLWLEDVPAEVPAGGVIYFTWGRETKVESLNARERVTALAGSRSVLLGTETTKPLLMAVPLPAYRITRPRGDVAGAIAFLEKALRITP
jgi:hypothetical protein